MASAARSRVANTPMAVSTRTSGISMARLRSCGRLLRTVRRKGKGPLIADALDLCEFKPCWRSLVKGNVGCERKGERQSSEQSVRAGRIRERHGPSRWLEMFSREPWAVSAARGNPAAWPEEETRVRTRCDLWPGHR